ncbi:hypothetical protein WUBG_17029 [Wuchereria bancrofti]|uniref:Protein kinase domain-containing protein n=1 Tax=Wuchereria bancrofti TaxID=6293 RepID=J9ADK6_WUCBA|nr:hypothetical protein WUBG_17029 [Wuchereria bancrofti]
MVSYYPNEKWHRLPRMFALQMEERRMPFRWMINDMMVPKLCILPRDKSTRNCPFVKYFVVWVKQILLKYCEAVNRGVGNFQQLCVRMTQSGDGHLKQYLNDTMLNLDPSARPTAKQITWYLSEQYSYTQYNLKRVTTVTDYKNYSTSADIWSLGVLILHMVSYYPNEKWHRLPRMFALQMEERRMPFRWMINDMMVPKLCILPRDKSTRNCPFVKYFVVWVKQILLKYCEAVNRGVGNFQQLCVRMTQSGDGHLKQYLNDTMLNLDPSARPTAKQILESHLIKKWCNKSLDQVVLRNNT